MEIDRETWRGKIPCTFHLAEDDCTSLSPPQPFYLLIPRHSYLHLAAADIIDHFKAAASEQCEPHNVWFSVVVEQNGLSLQQPLKWQLPVGTLYDLYASTPNPQLPWQLTVHVQGYPSDKLLSLENNAVLAVKSSFMNAIKQALFLKLGSKGLQALSQEQTAQLWSGITTDKFDLFWQINQLLSSHNGPMRHLPVRIVQRDAPMIQQPIKPVDEQGRPWTLGSVLVLFLPNRFEQNKQSTSQVTAIDNTTVCIQGVSPSLATPLDELCRNLSSPDSFLYVTLRLAE